MIPRSSGASDRLLQARRSHGSLPWFKQSLQRPCLITSTNSPTHSPQPHSILFALWIFENFASSHPVLVHFVSAARRVYKHDPLQCEVNAYDILSTSAFLREFEDPRSEIASNNLAKPKRPILSTSCMLDGVFIPWWHSFFLELSTNNISQPLVRNLGNGAVLQVYVLLQNFLRCKWNRKFAFFVDGTGHFLVIAVRLSIHISLGRTRCPWQEQCNFFCQHTFIVVLTCATSPRGEWCIIPNALS